MPVHNVILASRQPPAGIITYEEFLDWCDEDTLAEWVQGRVEMSSPAALAHQRIVDFVGSIMLWWVRAHDLGEVILAPFQMKLPPPVETGREPDVIFVSKEHAGRWRRTYLDGPADVVVEVTSPESLGRDRGQKFVEYERAGIPEYWFIDPDRKHVEFNVLGSDGHYHAVMAGASGEYVSPTLAGFRLEISWLWEEPRPDEAQALRSLGLIT